MSKIALINPGKSGASSAMPIGLAYLAGYVRANGHQVVVKDMEVEPEELECFLQDELPDYVGITVLTLLYPMSHNIIKRIRSILPQAIIIVGGPHITAIKEKALVDIPEADLAVYGEGEITLLEILNGKEYSQIDGLIWKEGINKPREFIKDLDALPTPAYDLFPLSKYRIHPPYGRTNHFMNLNTSRGCPFGCAYCSKNFGRTYRSLSAEKVVSEIQMLIQTYGIKEIHFYDDDFTMSKERIHKICDLMLEKKIKIIWSCTTRVDLVDIPLLDKMKRAGCWLITFGVESGNQEILDTITKGYKIQQVRDAFRWTKERGIKRLGFFMLGLPGETKETIQESIQLAKEIDADYTGWAITMVLPNTNIRGIYEQRGAKIYPAPAESLAWLPEQGDNPYVEYAQENFTHEELSAELKQISKAFYLNPKFIVKEFLQVRSYHELSQLVRAGISVIKGGN